MTTTPHTHRCSHCQSEVPCEWAARGGCLFASTSPVTCTPCADAKTDRDERLREMTAVAWVEMRDRKYA